jgi:hypothetical protein
VVAVASGNAAGMDARRGTLDHIVGMLDPLIERGDS